MFIVLFVVFFSPSFDFIFSVVAKKLAGKSIPKMTYSVLSGTLNLNPNQSITEQNWLESMQYFRMLRSHHLRIGIPCYRVN